MSGQNGPMYVKAKRYNLCESKTVQSMSEQNGTMYVRVNKSIQGISWQKGTICQRKWVQCMAG